MTTTLRERGWNNWNPQNSSANYRRSYSHTKSWERETYPVVERRRRSEISHAERDTWRGKSDQITNEVEREAEGSEISHAARNPEEQGRSTKSQTYPAPRRARCLNFASFGVLVCGHCCFIFFPAVAGGASFTRPRRSVCENKSWCSFSKSRFLRLSRWFRQLHDSPTALSDPTDLLYVVEPKLG